MKPLYVFQAELLKNRHSSIVWATFVAFGLAPLMGGVFMLILNDPEVSTTASSLALKAKAMNFEANWQSYFSLLTQAIGVGGVLVFGFVASWTFGREYSEGTAKDLLALPTSRTQILNAKFTVYVLWCLALVISNLVVAFVIGSFLQLDTPATNQLLCLLGDYFITTLLTILAGFPIAFFATWGKGYLTPLGFVALTLVLAQVIAATGYGTYFPWAIPGLYSGSGGEYKSLLTSVSYTVLIGTGILGYVSTVLYWKLAEQTK